MKAYYYKIILCIDKWRKVTSWDICHLNENKGLVPPFALSGLAIWWIWNTWICRIIQALLLTLPMKDSRMQTEMNFAMLPCKFPLKFSLILARGSLISFVAVQSAITKKMCSLWHYVQNIVFLCCKNCIVKVSYSCFVPPEPCNNSCLVTHLLPALPIDSRPNCVLVCNLFLCCNCSCVPFLLIIEWLILLLPVVGLPIMVG